MQVGFVAGAVALGLGTVLGVVAGYVGGVVDAVIRGLADILLTVPGLVVLVTIAASIKGVISVEMMALVVASLAWMWPTRTIRSQVLTLRERSYVQIAKMSGMRTPEVIFAEVLPEPAALPRGVVRRLDVRGDSRLDRVGGARSRAAERADARHDDLLGDLVQRTGPRAVVVVADADLA